MPNFLQSFLGLSAAVALALVVGGAQGSVVPELGAQRTGHRHLADGFEFSTDSYFDSRTGVLRQYMEDLLASQNKGDPQIEIRSTLDSDNTYTTGNADRLVAIDRLIPSTDFPAINQNVFAVAKSFQKDIQVFLDYLSPDVFSEDPNVFMGDSQVYYLITRKRGILFYYLSRAVFYGLLIFLLYKFVVHEYRPKEEEVGVEDLDKRRPRVGKAQLFLVLATIGLSGLLINVILGSRSILTENFSDMMFRFKEIAFTIQQVVDTNNQLNALKVKVPGAGDNKFFVQTPLVNAVDLANHDIQIVDSFLTSFRTPEALVEVLGPLVLVLLGLVLLALDRQASVKRSYVTQFVVFLLSGVTLAIVFVNLEKYIVGFSAINDFCLSMMRYGNRAVYPYQGVGITNLLGCSVENSVFQQLYVNLIAQNAALKVFNNEMYAIGREQVASTDEALEVIAFMQRLESSNKAIDRLAILIRKNTLAIQDLMKINGCNTIKQWINKAQKDVCWTASSKALSGFVLLLIIAMVMAALTVVAYLTFKAMVRKHSGAKLSVAFGQRADFGNQLVLD